MEIKLPVYTRTVKIKKTKPPFVKAFLPIAIKIIRSIKSTGPYDEPKKARVES